MHPTKNLGEQTIDYYGRAFLLSRNLALVAVIMVSQITREDVYPYNLRKPLHVLKQANKLLLQKINLVDPLVGFQFGYSIL